MDKNKNSIADGISEIYGLSVDKRIELPEYLSSINAGFPSPADDYVDKRLDLNELLIKHPASTFFVRVIGDSMINAGIYSGDLLVVDRAIEPTNNKIVLAVVDGEFTVKRYVIRKNKIFLVPENENYPEIEINEDMNFEVWGVVTNVIHEVK